jgi:hypothetical protein
VLCLCGLYGYHTAVTAVVGKLDCTVNECIEGVVAAHADILAGIVNSAPLAYDDVAGYTSLTTTNLYT